MKAWAVLLAAVSLVAVMLVVLFTWFLANGPWENTTEEDRHRVVVELVLPALVIFVFACLTLLAIAIDKDALALAAYGGQVVIGLVLLARGLDASTHSDGKVVLFALAVQLPGALAVLLKRNESARS
jgi:hypothetical protein